MEYGHFSKGIYDTYFFREVGAYMTIEDFTKHYVKAFKKGPLSSETRKAYDDLKQYGESLGINLNKAFFEEIIKEYQEEPQKYVNKDPDEINQDILVQCRMYMQQIQEKEEKPVAETRVVKQQERRGIIEIL